MEKALYDTYLAILKEELVPAMHRAHRGGLCCGPGCPGTGLPGRAG